MKPLVSGFTYLALMGNQVLGLGSQDLGLGGQVLGLGGQVLGLGGQVLGLDLDTYLLDSITDDRHDP